MTLGGLAEVFWHCCLSKKQELETPSPHQLGLLERPRKKAWSERRDIHCLEIHLLNGCLLNTRYVPGTEPGTEDVVANKRAWPHTVQGGGSLD